MASDLVANTNAVFTSDRFDREWHPEGGDSHPPPGRDFAIILGRAFVGAGWDVMELPADPPPDEHNDHWEHTYWYLHITRDAQSYWVHLEPIGDANIWRIALHRRRGCLPALFLPLTAPAISSDLRSDAESIIQRVSGCSDLRWVTDDEAESLW